MQLLNEFRIYELVCTNDVISWLERAL